MLKTEDYEIIGYVWFNMQTPNSFKDMNDIIDMCIYHCSSPPYWFNHNCSEKSEQMLHELCKLDSNSKEYKELNHEKEILDLAEHFKAILKFLKDTKGCVYYIAGPFHLDGEGPNKFEKKTGSFFRKKENVAEVRL